MALKALLKKSPDPDFLREMIGFANERLVELDAPSLTGAAHGERTRQRLPKPYGLANLPNPWTFRFPESAGKQ